MTIRVCGFAARRPLAPLKPWAIEREEVGPNEIEIEVLFCGVSHQDVHRVENAWGDTIYPCMPGHEIVGRVTSIGEATTRHQVGDLVGVGAMIDSCDQCGPCRAGQEQHCEGPNGWLATYNGPRIPASRSRTGLNMYRADNTYGGYSSAVIVKERFAVRMPATISLRSAAPILCAGALAWSPLKRIGIGRGGRVGVIGLGGLGHIAIKLLCALGAEVTVLTRTPGKVAEAERLGARGVLMADHPLASLNGEFDILLSTVPQPGIVEAYIPTLAAGGTLVAFDALAAASKISAGLLATGRKPVVESLLSSIAEIQEALDFCVEHGIEPEVQVIPIQEINEAFLRLKKGEPRFRYVLDASSIHREWRRA